MKIPNPFRLNDWNIKDFLLVVLALQIAVVASIVLDVLGLGIPLFRQITGFVYLTFVPGFILLRVLKLHNLNVIENLLFSIGLSIAFLMLIGLLMNALYPIMGISQPISTLPLMLTISAVVLIFCILAYVRDKNFSSPNMTSIKDILPPAVFALLLLPLLSVLGTYLMNFGDSNTLLLILLVIISVMPILAMFGRFPKKLYPMAVFVIALALLYHNSLISTYLTGWDVQTEYYFANKVESNSYWTSSIPNNYNAMLSIVMLAPILSNICNMSLVWVFKILYPLLFSLVPLGLYRIFQKQTDEKTAFLSCFFFISIFTFYSEMLALARQQIAELFLVLLVLLMIERNMNLTKKSTLGIIFAFSLVTSHYGLSYIFVFTLIIVWIVLFFKKWQAGGRGIADSYSFVLLCLILAFTWYVYVSSSSVFTQVVKIGDHIAGNIFDFLNPTAVEGLSVIVTRTRSLLHEVTKYLYLMVNFLIFIGTLATLLKRTETRFEKEYIIFSSVSLVMCVGGMTVPYFASTLNTSRIYQIALLSLAPFLVIGAKTALEIIGKAMKRSWENKRFFVKVLAVFLTIFFLLDSGLIYEIAKSEPTSISLNKSIDFPRFTQQEVITVGWLENRMNSSIPAYADLYRSELLLGVLGEHYYLVGDTEVLTPIQNKTYFFLGSKNVKSGEIVLFAPDRRSVSTQQLQNLAFYYTLLGSNKIYDNGDAQVYFYPYNQIMNFTSVFNSNP